MWGISTSTLIFLIGHAASQLSVCPNDWVPFNDHCYLFNIYPMSNYDGAINSCEEHGAYLVSVETLAESQFIIARLRSIGVQSNEWYTSGERDSSRVDRYRWTATDTPVDTLIIQIKNKETAELTKDIMAYVYDAGLFTYSIMLISDRTIIRPYICEISRLEAYRINLQDRDFDYGVPHSNVNDVKRGPKFIIEATSTVVISDRPFGIVYLECLASGIPQPEYEWRRSDSLGTTVINSEVNSRYTITNGKLTIENPVESEDGGFYECWVSNSEGSIISPPAQLSFAFLGDFSNNPTATVTPQEHQGAVIECPNIGSNHMQSVYYQWKMQDELRWDSRIIDVRPDLNPNYFISGSGQLYFSDVTTNDNKFYYCIATLTSLNFKQNVINNGNPSKTSRPVELAVRSGGGGEITPRIQDSFINVVPNSPTVGMNITLECFAYGTLPLSYTWDVPRWVFGRYSFDDNQRKLKIENVQLEDTGLYRCNVRNRQRPELDADSKNFTLYVESKPMFVVPLMDQHLDVGVPQLTWRCEARAIPFPTYSWYKDGQRMQNSLDGQVKVQGNTLFIRSPNKDRDSGVYQCLAENTHGMASTSAQLRVLAFAPSFAKYPMSPTIAGAVGGDVKIQCRPEAAPFPELGWFRNGGTISATNDPEARIYITTSGTLVIKNLNQGDAGRYECRAENSLGADKNSTYLSLYDETSLYLPPRPKTVLINQTAVLNCEASFNKVQLDIVYEWLFNGHVINFFNSKHYRKTSDSDGRLYIMSAQYYHQGVYTCKATTQVDAASGSAYLKVMGPPTEPSGVTAYNVEEKTSDLNVDFGQRSVLLRWSDPKGMDITHYTIYAQTNYSDHWSSIYTSIPAHQTIISGVVEQVDQSRRQFIIQDLRPGVAYRFKVRGINNFGVGEESQPTTAKTVRGDKPARYPSNIGGGGGSVGTIRITWDPLPPEDMGGWGIGYEVEYRLKPADGLGNSNAKWTKIIVESNVGEASDEVGKDFFYREYQVQVTPINMYGVGPTGRNDSVMSAEAIPNGIPGNIYAEPFNESAITVYWNPVPNTREVVKGKLKGYKILYWLKDIETQDMALQSIIYGDVDHGRIIGLQPDTWYTVTVVVFNGAGNGVKAEVAHQSTDRSAPLNYPVHIQIYPHSESSVRVRFRGVSTSTFEEPLLGYKLRYWEDTNDIRFAKDVDLEKNTEGIIYGIQPQLLYHMRVLGYSVGGDGKMSSPETLFSFMANRVSQIMVDPTTSKVMYVMNDAEDASTGTVDMPTSLLSLILLVVARFLFL